MLYSRIEIKQYQPRCDAVGRHSTLPGDPGVAEAGLGQALEGLRLVDRVQILPLQVLDQRTDEPVLVARLLRWDDDGGYLCKPRGLRGPPAPFAPLQYLPIRAVRLHRDRLHDSAPTGRGRQLFRPG